MYGTATKCPMLFKLYFSEFKDINHSFYTSDEYIVLIFEDTILLLFRVLIVCIFMHHLV
jgi:hypothetical protein